MLSWRTRILHSSTVPHKWFAQLGLPSNLLDGREPAGTWIGPVVRDRNGTTAAALFYYCAVEIAQVLNNGEGIIMIRITCSSRCRQIKQTSAMVTMR